MGFSLVVVVGWKSEKQKSGSWSFLMFQTPGCAGCTAKGADLIRVLPPGTAKRLPKQRGQAAPTWRDRL